MTGDRKSCTSSIAKTPMCSRRWSRNQSEPWRRLDVAILQRYLIDEVITPKFGEPTKAYTAYENDIAPMTDGNKFQIALLLKSTPLGALEQLGGTAK